MFSQALKSLPEHTWVNQKINSTPLAYANNTYVGNYTILNSYEQTLQSYLRSISEEKVGTLFMVVRPKSDSLSARRLLKLGRVSLYRDSLVIDGTTVDIKPIEKEPVIVRVRYQGRTGRSWLSKKHWIGKEVDLAELVFYDDILVNEEARIVESLLAIKYSINITKNDDPDYRDYVSIYEDIIWDQGADKNYDEEVMALGRLDRVDFFQSQSLSANSKSIRISLDSVVSISKMPTSVIQDSSLLMILKGDEQLKPQCGSNAVDFLFKIKFFNWASTADTLFIEMDTLFNYSQIRLSDGGTGFLPVLLTQGSNKALFKIPLSQLDFSKSYFLVGILPPDTCTPLYDVTFNNCDSNSLNSVNIAIDTNVLPVSCSLIEMNSGLVLDTLITNPYSRFLSLGAGHYELMVNDTNGIIVHSVFELNECPSFLHSSPNQTSENNSFVDTWVFEGNVSEEEYLYYTDTTGTLTGRSKEKEIKDLSRKNSLNTAESESGEGIFIYPNPIPRGGQVSIEFANLNEVNFTIQIIDNKGAVLRQDAFTPEHEDVVYRCSLLQPGAYLVRIHSSQHIAIQTIIVK